MISLNKWISISLVVGVAGLMTQSLFAQTYPLVPSADPGTARPYVWGNSADAYVHGPGNSCTTSTPCYYYPGDVQTAYATAHIPNGNGGAGRTIAIVDAYSDPNIAANLAAFNADFGLAPCTVASGCLTIVNQTGGSTLPPFNANWAVEANLDVQWSHVMAPNAHILLVETNSNSFADLGAGNLYAQLHGDVVSNSWGASEGSGESSLDTYWSSSTVPILFSSGDDAAAGHQYPCASTYITCVGGTTLQETSTSFRAAETGWADGGGGCSTEIGAPAWQAGYVTMCAGARGMPDIAAIADPNSGALVYLNTNVASVAGLYVVGGTSWACPMMAGVVAQIQNGRIAASKPEFGLNLSQALYSVAGGSLYHYRFYDVTSGNNGDPAGPGWDLVTGLGVPLSPALTAGLIAY